VYRLKLTLKRLRHRLRLFHAWLFGVPIGEWETSNPIRRDGKLHAWRLLPNGEYEYRELTEAELAEHLSGDW
jgi:hypothetical protein